MTRQALESQAMLIALIAGAAAAIAGPSDIKADEQVVFYPTYGRQVDAGAWEVRIHGWIFEPDDADWTLDGLLSVLEVSRASLSAAERGVFESRARPFLVDSERDKRIGVRIGKSTFELPPSGPDGHFQGTLRVSAELVAEVMREPGARPNVIPFRAVMPAGDARVFGGEVRLIAPRGISVISDIDDTIRISHVTNRAAMIRSAFFEPLEPVPGMARLYQRWADREAAEFHYVSSGPWQLYEPLERMRRESGFPAGTWHLRPFRLKRKSSFDGFGDPGGHKRAMIEPLLADFPERYFVLVGDSGEKDPEIYADLGRRYPKQIVRIFIRDIGIHGENLDRFCALSHELPDWKWRVFLDPNDIAFEFPEYVRL